MAHWCKDFCNFFFKISVCQPGLMYDQESNSCRNDDKETSSGGKFGSINFDNEWLLCGSVSV